MLKTALDHLFAEWAGKPAVIGSYGGHGGNKCAGQLRQVAEALKMRQVMTMPGITLTRSMIEGGGQVDPELDFWAHVGDIRLAFAGLVSDLESVPAS